MRALIRQGEATWTDLLLRHPLLVVAYFFSFLSFLFVLICLHLQMCMRLWVHAAEKCLWELRISWSVSFDDLRASIRDTCRWRRRRSRDIRVYLSVLCAPDNLPISGSNLKTSVKHEIKIAQSVMEKDLDWGEWRIENRQSLIVVQHKVGSAKHCLFQLSQPFTWNYF